MNYIFILLGFFSFSLWSYKIDLLLNEKAKKYCFLVAASLITFILFHLTLLTSLWNAQIVIYFAALVVLGIEIYKFNFNSLKFFFQKYKLFFALSFALFLLTIKAQVLGWDDFFWASFVKSINMFGTYWTDTSFINQEVLRYFPGIPLWESFFIGPAFFNEHAIFFAVGLIFMAGFNAFLPKELSKKNSILFSILFCSGIFWFAPGGMNNISSEGTISMLFAFILLFIYDLESPVDLIACLAMIVFLAITKETAFLLALLCIFIIVMKLFREKKLYSKEMAIVISGFSLVIANYITWQKYLKKVNLTVPVSNIIWDSFRKDLVSISSRTHDVLITFFDALFSKPLPSSLYNNTFLANYFNIHGNFVLCALVILCILLFIRDRYEYLTGYLIGLLGYTCVHLSYWLYFVGPYEGRLLFSYQRYFGVFFLGFTMLLFKIILEKKFYLKNWVKNLLIITLIIFPPSIKIFYSPAIKTLVPEWVNKIVPFKQPQTREELAQIKSKIIKNVPLNAKTWFVWQNSTGIQNMVLRYEVGPRQISPGKWSIGEKYYDGDVWTAAMNTEQFGNELKNWSYLALGKIDEKFIKMYSKFFKDPPKDSALYEIIAKENNIELKELQ